MYAGVRVSTFHMQAAKLLHNLSKTSEKKPLLPTAKATIKGQLIVQVSVVAVVVLYRFLALFLLCCLISAL